MKQIFVSALALLFLASTAFAADFAPATMTLEAPDQVSYGFDGSELSIPVTVTGTPAAALFLVFTKGKGAQIGAVQNGFLGWHYVNSIDTCIYVSNKENLVQGSNTIKWDGNDADGGAVPEGEYTYYVWAYDDQSPRTIMSKQIVMQPWKRAKIITHAEDGTPLDNPVVWDGSGDRGNQTENKEHTNKKWIVGSDPDDATLLETCITMEDSDVGGLMPHPDDYGYFFKCTLSSVSGTKKIMKWSWVPNGNGELQTDWAEDGIFTYSVDHPAGWEFGPGVVWDGGENMIAATSDLSGAGTESELIWVSIEDGEEVVRLDLADWYVSTEDADADGQMSSGPTEMRLQKGTVICGSHSSCMNIMLDPQFEDEDMAVLWANDNGDYVGDHNFEETSEKPWVCNDYNVGPYKYNIVADDQLFSTFTSFDVGAVSFGLYAPDGTGLGYHAFSGETAAQKYDIEVIDYGSAYDGYYTTNISGEENTTAWWHVAHDSISGVISSGVGVADDAPAAFAVAQNTPNPFNPTTTISFTLANAGTVNVDVYNVAGQKVDTIVNEFMDSGSHSVVWDASDFSAGVYFYTVKGGDFSKTMKMTLVK